MNKVFWSVKTELGCPMEDSCYLMLYISVEVCLRASVL